ncbi:DNA-binding NtrC family response regulator [Rhodoligotrophos appendicifer]|uniref:response regulator n=1 Tax=Rhodoligotrophos appendicifer TaxID=987056 RepID=UPI001184EC8C|nr:response regulator [Rhodoligotrophos appendicifer]
MADEKHKPVLVVEDEPIILLNAVDHLHDIGHVAYAAANASEAMDLLNGLASGIDVLFTDINMPGEMDGIQLVELVHARWPHIGLIVTSGHERLASSTLPDDGIFISKPYDLEQLSKLLDEGS